MIKSNFDDKYKVYFWEAKLHNQFWYTPGLGNTKLQCGPLIFGNIDIRIHLGLEFYNLNKKEVII